MNKVLTKEDLWPLGDFLKNKVLEKTLIDYRDGWYVAGCGLVKVVTRGGQYVYLNEHDFGIRTDVIFVCTDNPKFEVCAALVRVFEAGMYAYYPLKNR